MTVRFSTRAPNSDYLGFEASPEAIVTAAKKAEELGFDAIFVNDHIIVGNDARSAPWTNVYDPLVAMSFIAAHTTRIGVGVSVLIMPYRNPIVTAKALTTLDRMSDGRLIAGVRAGWNEAEFAALGVPFDDRGARTNEYLRLWQACWAPGKVSFAGKFVSFADMHVSPKTAAAAASPIWIGGASDAALRRAARFAAVWQPTPLPVTELVERRAALRQACEDTRARADPDADELSGRDQHHYRERASDRQGAANRARHSRRDCCRFAALPRSGRCRGLPDQLPWQPRPRTAAPINGVLHARGKAAGRMRDGSASRSDARVDWVFTFVAAAYNLVRMPKLIVARV
jgi:probable F420-dependent oxidoreductase